jgi:hypothetical protein
LDFDPEVWFADCPAKSRKRVLNTWDCHMHAMKMARDFLVGPDGHAAEGTALSSVNKFSQVLTSECDGNDEVTKAGRLHDLADRMNDQFQQLFFKKAQIPARRNRSRKKQFGITYSVRSSAGSANNGNLTPSLTASGGYVSSLYSPLMESCLPAHPSLPQELFLPSGAPQQLPLPSWDGFTPLDLLPVGNDLYSPGVQEPTNSVPYSAYWPASAGLETGRSNSSASEARTTIAESVGGASHLVQNGEGLSSGFEDPVLHSSWFSFAELPPELLLAVSEYLVHQNDAA